MHDHAYGDIGGTMFSGLIPQTNDRQAEATKETCLLQHSIYCESLLNMDSYILTAWSSPCSWDCRIFSERFNRSLKCSSHTPEVYVAWDRIRPYSAADTCFRRSHWEIQGWKLSNEHPATSQSCRFVFQACISSEIRLRLGLYLG